MSTSLFFDASAIEPQQSYSPIPAGVYVARIVESEVKPLKSGNGTGLSLQFEILEGSCVGRMVFANLNIQHSSVDAERIGQSQLSQLCHAVNVIKVKDTQQLHNIPVKIKVKIRKDESGQYGDRNEVTQYEAVQGATLPAFQAPKAQQKATQSTAPWANKG